MTRVLHPRQSPRRAGSTTWWGKAWVRAVEESAYDETDLRRARSLARSGRIGQVTVDDGSLYAAVIDGEEVWTVTVGVPLLADDDRTALVEAVAAESGRIAALLAGDLPFALVEHAEESGVELLPYGGELEAGCTCGAWTMPCAHALAVLQQVAWLVDDDPLVLFHLRGLGRDALLARLHARAPRDEDDDLDEGVDAALRARRVLELLEDPGHPVDHLF